MPRRAEPEAVRDGQSRPRVLVVDDEESITELVSTALRYEGFEVEVAGSGRGALTAATSFRPHLIVLDVMLPDLDGFEVQRRLSADRLRVPILFLARRGSRGLSLHRGRRRGVADQPARRPSGSREAPVAVRGGSGRRRGRSLRPCSRSARSAFGRTRSRVPIVERPPGRPSTRPEQAASRSVPILRCRGGLAQAQTFLLGGRLPVHRLALGTFRLVGPGGFGPPPDPGEARRLLRRALELGANLIDTADTYGPGYAEELIAEALAPYPDGLVIATKGGSVINADGEIQTDGSPAHLSAACEASRVRLRLDRIPLYQLHVPDPQMPIEGLGRCPQRPARGGQGRTHRALECQRRPARNSLQRRADRLDAEPVQPRGARCLGGGRRLLRGARDRFSSPGTRSASTPRAGLAMSSCSS